MRRPFAFLFSMATVIAFASQADAIPPGFTPPKITPPASLQLQKPPPPGSAAYRPNIVINPGRAPTDAALIRTDSACHAGQECILFGRNLGKHDLLGRAPTGYELVVAPPTTNVKGAKTSFVPTLTVTAWNENLVAFTGLNAPGSYTVMVRTTPGGKVLASLAVRVYSAPPTNTAIDEDHDCASGNGIVGGTGCSYLDCDDGDPQRYPGRAEVPDTTDHDEDCRTDTFGSADLDHDGHLDANYCNTEIAGTGTDRYFKFNCGDDCNDQNPAVLPGAMVCDPRGQDHSIIVLCNGHSGTGPADPRGAFEGTWAAVACSSYAGPTGHCISQPNGTGVCVP